MKRLLGILLLAFCANSYASVDYYDGNGVFFPDEVSPHGLPEAIPCVTKTAYTGQAMLVCTWLANARYVNIWDAQRQQDVRYTNQISGMCQRGTCRVQNGVVGAWKQNTPFLISMWYKIGTSTDGKPVAYRIDVERQVSYAGAGSLLWRFYQDAGIPDNELVSTFDKRYQGGWAAWNSEKGNVAKVSNAKPAVNSAWCNPRLDDDCYINHAKVPQAQLGQYLPVVSMDDVERQGGYCETVICFNEDDKPIGIVQ